MINELLGVAPALWWGVAALATGALALLLWDVEHHRDRPRGRARGPKSGREDDR